MGTLLGGGRTVTDAESQYHLYIGPGLATSINAEHAPLGVGVQASHFFANKPGWQLDAEGGYLLYLMTDQTPQKFEALLKENGGKVWGKDSAEEVVFARQPRELNLVLQRSEGAAR